MYECPNCGSGDLEVVNRAKGGCGVILMGVLIIILAAFSGVLEYYSDIISYLFIFVVIAGIFFMMWGGNAITCHKCGHKWSRG